MEGDQQSQSVEQQVLPQQQQVEQQPPLPQQQTEQQERIMSVAEQKLPDSPSPPRFATESLTELRTLAMAMGSASNFGLLPGLNVAGLSSSTASALVSDGSGGISTQGRRDGLSSTTTTTTTSTTSTSSSSSSTTTSSNSNRDAGVEIYSPPASFFYQLDDEPK